MPAKPPSAVIFLNPNLLAPVFSVGLIASASDEIGRISGPSLRNDPLEALATLARRIDAAIVGTANPITGTDARDMLLSRGLRTPWGPGWFAANTLAARAAGVTAWLSAQGTRPAVMIDIAPTSLDPEGSVPRGVITVSIPARAELTRATCDQVADMLLARRTDA